MSRETDLRPAATLAYGTDSPNQVVDLYVPDGSGPWPLVIGIHGGAFRAGTRNWELSNVPALLEQGYAVAAVEYRLSGEALFPAAVQDVKQATAYLRAHAGELGLDYSFFAAWGRSAGGHLSAMLGVTSGQRTEFDYPGGGDSSVQAVIDWYGPSDFLAAGTSDHLVPHQQTLILADALRAHGTRVELHILENGRHGDQRFETELKQPAIEWLEQLRKPS